MASAPASTSAEPATSANANGKALLSPVFASASFSALVALDESPESGFTGSGLGSGVGVGSGSGVGSSFFSQTALRVILLVTGVEKL